MVICLLFSVLGFRFSVFGSIFTILSIFVLLKSNFYLPLLRRGALRAGWVDVKKNPFGWLAKGILVIEYITKLRSSLFGNSWWCAHHAHNHTTHHHRFCRVNFHFFFFNVANSKF